MMTGFGVGDVVILNCGGPKMVIVEMQDDALRCAWTDADNELEMCWFKSVCVFKVHNAGEVGIGTY